MTTTKTPPRPAIAGSRLVLIGAILYLLEWVAIIGSGLNAPLGPGASTADLLASYPGHADAAGWAAGWFSVVEIGRILVMVGLASALAASGRRSTFMQVSVAAMGVSCALEITSYAIVAAAAEASAQVSVTTLRALDLVAYDLNLMLFGPFAVSMVCAGLAMWRSGLFVRVLPVLALAAGAMAGVLALGFTRPSTDGVVGLLSSATLPFWVWILWTGVLLWRRARRGADQEVPEPEPVHA